MANGFLPDDFIERVREHADAVRVIGDYIPLKKAGARHRALCPFHEEKTPSFYVNPVKGLFHCFGCRAGGDVFEFVKRIERVDFPGAVRLIAEKVGLPVPEAKPRRDHREEGGAEGQGGAEISTSDIYDVYREATAYYQKQLWEEGLGQVARDYLVSRGIGEEWARKIGMGYAPPGWENLAEHLKKKGVSPALTERAGLTRASQREGGSRYDTFRGRLLFPIHTPSGKVVAFGGRALSNDPDEPKYINSPEHPAFHKGRTLYGLHFSREAIHKRGFAILVEGYFDWLRLAQEGVENAVASCGTGFTREHAVLLRRYTGKTLVALDGDAPGRKAALSAVEALFEAELACAVLLIPDGADPDDFVRARGREAFLAALKNAHPALDFLVNEISAKHNLSSPHGKVQALNDLLPYLARIPSALERSEYLPRIRDRLGIEDSYLLAEVRRHLRDRRPALEPAMAQRASSSLPVTPAERVLLVAAIEDPSRTAEIVGRLRRPPSEGEGGGVFPAHLACLSVWDAVARRLAEGKTVSFASLCEDEGVARAERDFLAGLAVGDFAMPAAEELEGAFESLARRGVKGEMAALQSAIREAAERGDTERLNALMAQKMEISKKIHQSQ